MRKETKTTYYIDLSDGSEAALYLVGNILTIERHGGLIDFESLILPLNAISIRELHDAINEIEREVIGE